MSIDGRKVVVKGDNVVVPEGYSPLNDSGEYMNNIQMGYFKLILLDQAEKINSEYDAILETISSHNVDMHSVDEADMGNIHEELLTELRKKDRSRKLLKRIDETIHKIDNGTYGYCEKTGEEIGVKRLMFRPITKYCVEVQEELERIERATRGINNNEPADYKNEGEVVFE